MTIKDFIDSMTVGNLAGWAVALLIIFMSLIEISPLKLNPWGAFLGWIGGKLNRKTEERISGLEEKIADVEKQITDMWINAHRKSILTFARECREEITHSADEWSHILTVAEEYEEHCKRNNVSNGIVKADTEYIRNLYQELSRDHRI